MPRSLRLVDLSDRELLHIIHETQDPDGWSDAADIVKTIGIEHPRPAQCVGARFAWMKRYGVLEKEEHTSRSRWQLTPIGEVMRRGRINREDEKYLDSFETGQMLLLTRYITKRRQEEPIEVQHLTRREWAYGTMPRNGTKTKKRARAKA